MASHTPPKLTVPLNEEDHRLGGVDTAVTVIEYGDYECNYCHQVQPIIQEIQGLLGQQITYVFRHFPITSTHPYAQLAAEAAEAAAAQGKFWEMHNHLLAYDGVPDQPHLNQAAAELGLDVAQFEKNLDEHIFYERVRRDFVGGVRSGANGTPTFFINGVRYDGAWDRESLLEAISKPLGVRARLLAQEFMSLTASGGIVLLLATIMALIWANISPESYHHFWEQEFALTLGNTHFLANHLLEWVNDGLMVIFFFVVGLEIKREVTTGELANPKKAILPIAAAFGGMIVPALLYALFNVGTAGAPGWGIPMATDIAFTLGIMAMLGKRVPISLKVFFTALAIADDLGAVLVIAIFYTADISWISLGIGGLIFVVLLGLNRAKVYATLPYAVLGIGLWIAFLQSGIHPTIAGVLLALTIPTRSPANIQTLLAQSVNLLRGFDVPSEWRFLAGSRRQATIQTLENIVDRMQSPAQRLERDLHPWTTFVILPIFALANAGVTLANDGSVSLVHPVSLGIVFGLVLGKPIGISLLAWLAVKSGLGELPSGVGWRQLLGASCLAGIGFTISLFIAGSAFEQEALQSVAKLAILAASSLSAVLGWAFLYKTSRSFIEASDSHIETAVALHP